MKDTFRILIAGDLCPSGTNIPLFEQGDVGQLFGKEICRLFSDADFSIINLEGALTDSNEKQEKAGPVIKAPKACVNGLKELGVSAVALANNHITDYGNKGYEDTIDALESRGLQYVGAGRRQKDVKSYIQIDFGTKRVCIYNVSDKFFNVPGEDRSGANVYDEYTVCNEIKRLRSQCDYLIVIYHGGAEYFQYPTDMVRKRCHRMAESGADFITAQHTHCIGCEEIFGKSYILYGQGNFLFSRQKSFVNLSKDGLLLELCFMNSGVKIVKHHVVISGDIIRYDACWNDEEFRSRSRCVEDSDMIMQKFREFKANEIMDKFLLAAQGTSIISRIGLKFFPGPYKKYLSKKYTRKQILMNICVIGQDRRNEDMLAVWEYLLEKTK